MLSDTVDKQSERRFSPPQSHCTIDRNRPPPSPRNSAQEFIKFMVQLDHKLHSSFCVMVFSIVAKYLFNQTIPKYTEVKDLSEGVGQIADGAKCETVKFVHFGGLVGEQGEVDGGGEHVQEQRKAMGVSNGGHQPKTVNRKQRQTGVLIEPNPIEGHHLNSSLLLNSSI